MRFRSKSTLLSVVASFGVVGTSVLTALSTKKAVEQTFDKELSLEETVKIYAKEYIPSILMGTATIGCIIGASVLNARSQASLMSAYAVLDRSFKEYHDKVKEILGEEKDKEIREAISREYFDLVDIPKPENEDILIFFDEISNRFFFRTMIEVADAEYHFNRILALRGYASLNEFYDFLGLTPTDYGKSVGWNLYDSEAEYGYQWVDFEHQLCEEPCDPDCPSYYLIYMPFPPHPDF